MADEKSKCANEPCSCVPQTGQAYCSEYCRHVATSGPPRIENVCECGHSDCVARP